MSYFCIQSYAYCFSFHLQCSHIQLSLSIHLEIDHALSTPPIQDLQYDKHNTMKCNKSHNSIILFCYEIMECIRMQ